MKNFESAKSYLIILSITLLVLIVHISYWEEYSYLIGDYVIKKVNVSSDSITVIEEKRSENGTKYVLFENGYFHQYWGYDKETTTEDDLKSVNCPYTYCVMTFKKNLLPHHHDYDAILFHAWDENITLPTSRSPHQLYIMVSKE